MTEEEKVETQRTALIPTPKHTILKSTPVVMVGRLAMRRTNLQNTRKLEVKFPKMRSLALCQRRRPLSNHQGARTARLTK